MKKEFWDGFEKRAKEHLENKPSLTRRISEFAGRTAGRLGMKKRIDDANTRYKDIGDKAEKKYSKFYKEHALEPFRSSLKEGDLNRFNFKKKKHNKG